MRHRDGQMTLATRPISVHSERRADALKVRREPGIVERSMVVLLLFISQFGTPTDWFSQRFVDRLSGVDTNPLLVFGALGLVALLLIGLVGNGEAVRRALHLEPWLVVFVAVVALSTIWSENPVQGISDFGNFLVSTTLALILFVRYRFAEVIQLVVIAFAVGVVLHFVWVFALPEYGRILGTWVGLSVNKNFLGMQAVQTIPFFILGGRALRRWRLVLYGFAIAAAVLVVGSQSKTSLAAGALTISATIVYTAFRARKTLYGAVALTLGATSTVAMLFATANIKLIARWLDKDVTLSGRSEMWPLLIDDILERPAFGYGYGGYWGGYLSPAHEVWVTQGWFPTHAHNAALEVALRVGLAGLAVLVIVNARALVRATKLIRDVPGALSMLPLVFLTLVLMSSITESGVLPQRFGWTMFVYMCLIVGHARRSGARSSRASAQRASIAPTSGAPVRRPPE